MGTLVSYLGDFNQITGEITKPAMPVRKTSRSRDYSMRYRLTNMSVKPWRREAYRTGDGSHLGSFDHKTGEQLDPPKKNRSIKKYL